MDPQIRMPTHRTDAGLGMGAYFVPLAFENRTHVDTACAAYHLGRQPQTMRSWACRENGPMRPTRINGRLAWSVCELRRLLAG
jgi:hypothetical protein